MPENNITESALDAKARRAAKGAGLTAQRSRWRAGTVDNYGRFRLVDPDRNVVVCGERFDMSPEDVIEFCR